MIRGQLSGGEQNVLRGAAFPQCTACSTTTVAALRTGGWPWLLSVLRVCTYPCIHPFPFQTLLQQYVIVPGQQVLGSANPPPPPLRRRCRRGRAQQITCALGPLISKRKLNAATHSRWSMLCQQLLRTAASAAVAVSRVMLSCHRPQLWMQYLGWAESIGVDHVIFFFLPSRTCAQIEQATVG